MSLNANERISATPDIAHERSRIIKPYKHTTTMTAGKLVPFYLEDALPGSTYSLDTSFFCRMLTPIAPVLDEAYLDTYFFFVPYRLLWDHWREFYGENTSGYWAQQIQYNVPRLIKDDELNSGVGSVWDHFGFPNTYAANDEVYTSALPFRAYCMIWNEWFRNENTDNPTYLYTGDNDIHTTSGSTALYGGKLLDVCRMHDYFSDCLPTAQKLPMPVTIPLLGDNRAPVYPMDGKTFTGNTPPSYVDEMRWTVPQYDLASQVYDLYRQTNNSSTDSVTVSGGQPSSGSPGTFDNYTYPNNLWADFTNVSGVTINALREAIAVQRYAERLALGGSRYTEQLATFYGLTTQDSRLQRPEFIGSERWRINMSQVVQTSETGTTPQGNASGLSVTSGRGCHVTYSIQEHGVIMGLCCIRHDRSYQQGVRREWLRRDLYDFFQPPFGHLGNQSVTVRELNNVSNKTTNDTVFGYQEAWAEYRYKPNDISGFMRSGLGQGSLDIWHYGDWYGATIPTLSQTWMAEGSSEIARTLAVVDPNMSDQFLVQFSVPTDMVAPIPLFSVPGMMDHF